MASLQPLTYGRVVGRFLSIIGDSADGGSNPDAEPATGTVTFTPVLPAENMNFIKLPGAFPRPATISLRPITATLDVDGYLTFNGAMGVWLVATNNAAINIPTFMWRASFNLTYDGLPIIIPDREFTLPAGYNRDLGSDYVFHTVNNMATHNGQFELPGSAGSTPTQVSAFGGTAQQSTVWAASGTYSVRMQSDGSQPDPYASMDGDGALVPYSGVGLTQAYTAVGVVHIDSVMTGPFVAEARTLAARVQAASLPGGLALYTSAQAPNVVGTYELRLTFFLPADTTNFRIRVYNGSSTSGDAIYWDDVVLVRVPSVSEPFIGPLSYYSAGSPYYL